MPDHPDNTEKKTAGTPLPGDLLTLKELCAALSVSTATGRNWIRQGKLTAQETRGKSLFFTQAYADSVRKEIGKKENPSLKSRRNKKYISGNSLYRSYVSEKAAARDYVRRILSLMDRKGMVPQEPEICVLLAECACQLLLPEESPKPLPPIPVSGQEGGCLEAYLKGSLRLNGYEFLIDDLIPDREGALNFIHRYPKLFEILCPREPGEDLLGFLYLSIRNIGVRKATGSYYTPAWVIRKICGQLPEDLSGKRILDPCCGTGNFLLQLPESVPFDHIFGNDTDPISVRLTRINLALKYRIQDPQKLREHITCRDYLSHPFSGSFDVILGNPPWGYAYSEEEKRQLRSRYASACGTGVESAAVFTEQALLDLNPGGTLSFVLPEALLNVSSHSAFRKFLFQSSSFRYLCFLGNIFDGVHCPGIILQVQRSKTTGSCKGMIVEEGKQAFRITGDRPPAVDNLRFLSSDREYEILTRIADPAGKCFLAGNAVFALGIVTGDNGRFLSREKTAENEMVLKGADLRRFRFQPSCCYLEFRPDVLRQTAPEDCYRVPEKLLYRFISNQLVFAYDDRQTLSLNSCNLLIPQIEGLSVKYVLAVLNSRTAQFFFRKSFRSFKVLRSHLEQIPIPRAADSLQEEILRETDDLLASEDPDRILDLYNSLDRKIALLYGLSEAEYSLILSLSEKDPLLLP